MQALQKECPQCVIAGSSMRVKQIGHSSGERPGVELGGSAKERNTW